MLSIGKALRSHNPNSRSNSGDEAGILGDIPDSTTKPGLRFLRRVCDGEARGSDSADARSGGKLTKSNRLGQQRDQRPRSLLELPTVSAPEYPVGLLRHTCLQLSVN